jgi:2-keto-4-pentenoate hydratase
VSIVETERELFVRHAMRDGRSVARLRALDRGHSCVVEAEVFPAGKEPVHAGPYTFEDAVQATAFVTEAVESLLYLGCDVFAQ